MWKSVLHRQLATIWISALLRTDGSVKKFAPIGSLNMLRHGRCSFTTNKISHQSMTTTTKTSHTKQSNLHYKNSIDEKFSMEYRKLFLIGFASFCCVFVPKTCATFSTTQIQSKLATTLSLVFSALRFRQFAWFYFAGIFSGSLRNFPWYDWLLWLLLFWFYDSYSKSTLMLITIMASIFALLLTCINYSSINVEDDTFPPVKRNLVIKWDAFVSNATKNLREKIPTNQLAST